jgi:GrpB-like predicted nucleotidyltransferase (UPF0157 family)
MLQSAKKIIDIVVAQLLTELSNFDGLEIDFQRKNIERIALLWGIGHLWIRFHDEQLSKISDQKKYTKEYARVQNSYREYVESLMQGKLDYKRHSILRPIYPRS